MTSIHAATIRDLCLANSDTAAAANVPFDILAEHYLPSAGMPAAFMFMLRPRLVVKRNLSSGRGNFRLATNQKLANSATVRYPTSTSVHAKGCIVS